MSNGFHFTSKRGRKLLGVLEDAGGILLYNEIVKEMKGLCSESTTNRLLNDLSDKMLIFRIEHDGKIFYRVNDFPLEVKAMLSVLDSLKGMGETAEEEELIQAFASTFRQNIIMIYPKSALQGIFELTMREIESKIENDPFMEKLFKNLKNQLLCARARGNLKVFTKFCMPRKSL